jgi:hypothetical protein
MSRVPVTEAILRALADEVTKQLDLARHIDHPGESGRAREQILTSFIHRLVPSTFGVSTGFVVDAVGGVSKQVDVVIYRSDYAPIFEIGAIKHFLVEAVIAVVEVKAAITSTERLDQALANICSVKSLDRSNEGKNYTLKDRNRGDPVNRDSYRHQIFGAIVTERSLTRDLLRDRLLGFLRTHPRREWPNIYVDVNGPVTSYLGPGDPPQLLAEAMEGARLWLEETPSETYKVIPPLYMLAFCLVDLFRIAPTIDFDVTSYIPVRDRRGDSWPIDQ